MIPQVLFAIATICLFSFGHWIGALVCAFFCLILEFSE